MLNSFLSKLYNYFHFPPIQKNLVYNTVTLTCLYIELSTKKI